MILVNKSSLSIFIPMLFNDVFILQCLLLMTIFFFVQTSNIIILWYLAGLYLMFLGFFLLLDDSDVFIGFLWVIDLGVGLIFFIFILHFSTFLYQKVKTLITFKLNYSLVLFLIIFLLSYVLVYPTGKMYFKNFYLIWEFLITWYDYYKIYYNYSSSELNLMREIYFYSNSFEFFLINFLLFYGVISAILLCFLIRKIFITIAYNEFIALSFLKSLNIAFFIRLQNFINQQNTVTGVKIWKKKKKN